MKNIKFATFVIVWLFCQRQHKADICNYDNLGKFKSCNFRSLIRCETNVKCKIQVKCKDCLKSKGRKKCKVQKSVFEMSGIEKL